MAGIMTFDNMRIVAEAMADRAGGILRESFGKPLNIENKADASPVTQIDRAVESALREMIEKHFPDHGIIGEEYGNVRSESPYQWVLDPIDGTRAFIAGVPTFTTLISLAFEHVPILGVIDQPITKERWIGTVKGQATLNNTTIKTRSCDHLSHATIATTGMNYFTSQQAEIFNHVKNACKDVKLGGDAYLYAQLASGHIDIVIEAGLKPYDFCALRPVVEGAGGVIMDWSGKPLTTHSDGRVIACATKPLHTSVMELLGKQ